MQILPRLHVRLSSPVMMLCARIPGIDRSVSIRENRAMRHRLCSFLFALALIPATSLASSPWIKQFGGTGDDDGRSVTADASGNAIVTGVFTGSVDFGGGPVTSDNGDIYLAKYDSKGSHLWSRTFGGNGYDLPYDVAVDGGGNVVMTGWFHNTIDFGGGPLTSIGSFDIFVAKFNASDGTHVWSRRFGSVDDDTGESCAIDGGGNVVVSGYFGGTVNFGGSNLTSAGQRDNFLAKFDASGAHVWSKRFGDNGADEGLGIAVDGAGNIIMTGSFQGTVNFGGVNLVSAGSGDIFVAKFDPSGTHVYSLRSGDTALDAGEGVDVDVSGNAYVTGYFQLSADFGGGPLTSEGAEDIFLVKVDPNGAHMWSRRFGATAGDHGWGIDVDGAGNILATGDFSDVTIDLGGGPRNNAGSRDIYIASFDPDGAHRWSQANGGMGLDYGLNCQWTASGAPVVTGTFRNAANFSGTTLNSVGGADAFVLNLGVPPVSVVGQIPTSLALQVPNPVRGGPVQMRISLPVAASASLEIVAVTGQKVWSERFGGSPGVHDVTWDGRGKNATLAEPGVYFARLLTPLGTRTVRFVVLR